MSGILHHVQRPGRVISAVHRPTTVADALRLLAEKPGRRPIAGGTDILLDLQRGGPGEAVELIDLTHIDGFDRIDETDTSFELGGGVRHGQIVADARFVDRATPLAQACLEIGSPQLRNRATLAGNLATASPANDSLTALMALDAEVELSRFDEDSGAVHSRTVPVAELFSDFRRTVIESTELITRIVVPTLSGSQRGLWVKLGNRRAQAISVVHIAAVLDLDGDRLTGARCAFGSLAPTVVRLDDLAAGVIGLPFDDAAVSSIAAAAADRFEPIDDVRATADYRTATIRVVVERLLRSLRDGTHRDHWPVDPPSLVGHRHDRAIDGEASATASESLGITVNGANRLAQVEPGATLLQWLRTRPDAGTAGLDGTKEGCAEGECGACTVILDGAAVMSCLVLAAQAEGCAVTTVEGLADGDVTSPLQQSFIDEFAVQCGFCIPGFLMAGSALLAEKPEADDDQISIGFSGNLCRCTGYYPIREAVHRISGGGAA